MSNDVRFSSYDSRMQEDVATLSSPGRIGVTL